MKMKGNPARKRSIKRTHILQAKRHSNKLEQAERRDDCGLWNVIRKHLDLVVPLHKVEGGEHVGAGHVIRKILNVWNRVLVWNSSIVNSAKISTGVPRTIRFRHHMQGGRPWRIAPPDNASLLHLLELSLSSGVLLRVQTACWGRNRWALCLHVVANVVFSRPGRETETNYLRKLRQNFLIADRHL